MTLIPGTPRRASSATSKESIWRTPQWLVARIHADLGGSIDLDPCTDRDNPTRAKLFLTAFEDGLKTDWPMVRSIYVNPPFIHAAHWAEKVIKEAAKGHRPRTIFLGPAAVGTEWFQTFWRAADDALFLDKRLRFEDSNGNLQGSPTRGTVLFGLNHCLKGLSDLGIRGIAA